MTDDLERRLAALGALTIEPPSLGRIHRRARIIRRRRRATVGAVGFAAIVLLAVGALALRPTAPPTSVQSTGSTAPSETSLPATLAGHEPVSSDGRIVGFISDAALDAAMATGAPRLDIGTGAYPVLGFEVVGADRQLVGYLLIGDAGFVPLEAVADPADADQLGLAQEAELAEVPEGEVTGLIDDLRSQSYGD